MVTKLKLVADNGKTLHLKKSPKSEAKKKKPRKKFNPSTAYPFYKFGRYDPIMDELEKALYSTNMDASDIADSSKVSKSTLKSWKERRTMSPRNVTMAAALGALGYKITIVKDKDRRKK